MTELERYKEAVRVAMAELTRVSKARDVSSPLNMAGCASGALEIIDAILNPPPVFEEVTVERWTWGFGRTTFDTEEEATADANQGEPAYKLTGTRRVQVAQKVERSVSVEAHINGFGNVFSLNGDSLFSEHPEVHRKTGTLMFTWEE